MTIMQKIIEKSKYNPKKIIFPETQDERIIKAVKEISEKGIAYPVLLKNDDTLINEIPQGVEILDKDRLEEYAKQYYELRKHKGITLEQAKEKLQKDNYYAVMMLYNGEVDGMIAGAVCPTSDTLKPALEIIKTKEGIKTASSYFLMELDEKLDPQDNNERKAYFFADCAFVIDPDENQLSEIAISTADSAKQFGIDPKIAMLSFSTKGSAQHEKLEKIKNSVSIVKEKRKDLIIDGELQLDAAIIPEINHKKCPDSPIKGDANVLIFPDLNSGNIGYKLVNRMAKAKAIGPIVQGLNKPVNDLSRGCSVQDIVDVTAITVIETQKGERK
ncbi:MAG: phosphate acetyltransferase [Nanobdellota archaeon]